MSIASYKLKLIAQNTFQILEQMNQKKGLNKNTKCIFLIEGPSVFFNINKIHGRQHDAHISHVVSKIIHQECNPQRRPKTF